jgi:hypothetical protein
VMVQIAIFESMTPPVEHREYIHIEAGLSVVIE